LGTGSCGSARGRSKRALDLIASQSGATRRDRAVTVRLAGLPESTVLGLIAIFALGVTFDYINGFHDTANAIATSVATRALKPEYAIFLSASANFVGALVFGTAVAALSAADRPGQHGAEQRRHVLAAALLGAIA